LVQLHPPSLSHFHSDPMRQGQNVNFFKKAWFFLLPPDERRRGERYLRPMGERPAMAGMARRGRPRAGGWAAMAARFAVGLSGWARLMAMGARLALPGERAAMA
jgi:hypothetical protein